MQGGNLYAANIDKGTASCIATFNLQGGTIAPYAGNDMTIGCSVPSFYSNNIDLTLTGNGGTISSHRQRQRRPHRRHVREDHRRVWYHLCRQ